MTAMGVLFCQADPEQETSIAAMPAMLWRPVSTSRRIEIWFNADAGREIDPVHWVARVRVKNRSANRRVQGQ